MEQNLGKIDQKTIENFLIDKSGKDRPEVKIGPRFGIDVSIVDLPGELSMAMTSDPLSLIPSLGLEESAWLSVHLMANDMATTGHPPQYAQYVLNLPSTFSQNDFKIYWSYIHQFCKDIGTAVTGGHTCYIENQNSTIAGGGTFVTIAPKHSFMTSNQSKEGDAILITKSAAISSSAILAMSFPETVKNKIGHEWHQLACEGFYKTSSLQDALVAVGQNDNQRNQITAMHDVTEGGILGALYELAIASNLGLLVDDQLLPIDQPQNEVCKAFGLDFRFCIGAGSMIITCKNDHAKEVINRLENQNIPCVKVGNIKSKEFGIKWLKNEEELDLPYFEKDPYWAAYHKATSKGLR